MITRESKSLLLSSGTTGLRTWEAALHLGTYLSTPEGGDLLRGKRVVELGAGTGFLSLFCAKWLPVERVVATDCEEGLVANIARCVQLNELDGTGRIVPGIWTWGETLSLEDENQRRVDVAFGADLVCCLHLAPYPPARCLRYRYTTPISFPP